MSIKEFHKSTVKELLAVKDRVRNLINHWGEDGRYKEAVLKSIIQRFLPEKFKIASGFVVRQTDEREIHKSSTQIDLIIYDSSFPVLFKEGDFVILTPDAVNAIIEVKANIQNQNIQEILLKSNQNGKFIFNGKRNKTDPFFNGIFSYEGYENITPNSAVLETIKESNIEFENDQYFNQFVVNHISFNNHNFYKYWPQDNEKHYIYMIEDLSFAFFISNIIDYVGINSVIDNSNLWFPVDKSFNVISRF